jgi:uncharacterized protein (TIGR03083 family)
MAVQQAYERFVRTDGEELWERIDASQERFIELVRSIGPDVVGTGTTWSARDVVAHVLTVGERYTNRDVTSTDGLGETPREVDVINERELRALDGVPMDALIDRLEAQMARVKASFTPEQLDLHMRFPFHGGVTIDGAGAMSNLVGEFLIHGNDLARAAARPWRIDSRDALLIINGILQLLPAYAEPSARGRLDLMWRLPGAADWILAFDNGTATSRPADVGEKVDVILTAPPETLLLFMYQRLGPVAALRGGLRVAGGRKPWRIAKLQKFLQKP